MKRGLMAIGLCALFSGCFDLDLGLGPSSDGWNGGGGATCWFCVDFSLVTEDYSTVILKGDSIRVQVLSTEGHYRARSWSVLGRSVMLLDGGAQRASLDRTTSNEFVRGIAAGVDTVTAQASDTALTGSIALRVVDSSSVRAINLNAPPSLNLKVGDEFSLMGTLDYGGFEPLRWRPAAAAISNTAVVQTWTPQYPNPYAGVGLRAIAPGVADVTVAFLSLRKTVTITVTP
jgi:hypothetical protein